MTTETGELILAAHVRELATTLRKEAFQAVAAAVAAQYPDASIDRSANTIELMSQLEADARNGETRAQAVQEQKARWHALHPLDEFLAPALAELERIAKVMRGSSTS